MQAATWHVLDEGLINDAKAVLLWTAECKNDKKQH